MRAFQCALAFGALVAVVSGDGGGGIGSLPSNLQPLKMQIDGNLGIPDNRNPLPGNRGIPQGAGNGMSAGFGSSSSGSSFSNGQGSSAPAIYKASAQGDPVLQGFDNRAFEYFGKVGAYYNLISEKAHQVTMKLMEGHMWDHNGTYIEALGMQYQDHQVVIRLAEDALTVTLDNVTLVIPSGEHEVEEVLPLERGEMMVLWELHKPDYGSAVEITTDLLQVLLWVTPAGTRDEGGQLQPAYLNFEASLLGPPAHGSMNGLIGETYDFLVDNVKHDNDFVFHGKYPEEEYEMDGFFHHTHVQSLFGKTGPERRVALQEENAVYVKFPVKASGKGLMRTISAVPVRATKALPRAFSKGFPTSEKLGRKGL